MDAHSRGRAGEIDPAEQWVLDPRTGNYELRPNHSGTESPGPSLTQDIPSGQLSMMRSDTPFTEVEEKEQAAGNEQEAVLRGSRAETAGLRAGVLDGGDPADAADATVTRLRDKGVTEPTNKAAATAKTAMTTAYAPEQADRARALAGRTGLPATAPKQASSGTEGLLAMVPVPGADCEGAGVPVTGATKAPGDIQKTNADKAVCAQ